MPLHSSSYPPFGSLPKRRPQNNRATGRRCSPSSLARSAFPAARRREALAILGFCWLALASAGCQRDEEIRHYQVAKPEPAATENIRFVAPEGWVEGQKVVSRGGITIRHEAAFEKVDGDRRIAIAVDRMPGGGSLKDNVSRWSRQVGLDPASPSDLAGDIQEIEIGGMPADYIELKGEKESVYAAVASRDKPTWYIKLKGANELAASERERFKAFLESIQFE